VKGFLEGEEENGGAIFRSEGDEVEEEGCGDDIVSVIYHCWLLLVVVP